MGPCNLGCKSRGVGLRWPRQTRRTYVNIALTSFDVSRFLKHDDVIKWKHFPRHCPLVRGIHRSPVNSPHKSQWRGALVFSLICTWINDWVNNRKAGDLRRRVALYDVTVMNGKRLTLTQWRHRSVCKLDAFLQESFSNHVAAVQNH